MGEWGWGGEHECEGPIGLELQTGFGDEQRRPWGWTRLGGPTHLRPLEGRQTLAHAKGRVLRTTAWGRHQKGCRPRHPLFSPSCLLSCLSPSWGWGGRGENVVIRLWAIRAPRSRERGGREGRTGAAISQHGHPGPLFSLAWLDSPWCQLLNDVRHVPGRAGRRPLMGPCVGEALERAIQRTSV